LNAKIPDDEGAIELLGLAPSNKPTGL